jgi:cobalt-zinc-cadmium efflux system protein
MTDDTQSSDRKNVQVPRSPEGDRLSRHDCSHDHGHGHTHGHAQQNPPNRSAGRGHRHSHGHGHHHHHHDSGRASKNILFVFFLNLSFSLIELIGGLMIGSMAIIADAVHDLGDSISLGGAWFLERFANKARDRKFNFGYRRFSLLSALFAGVVISAGSIVIIVESIRRFGQASAPAGVPMIGLALLGLAVNGFAAWRLSRGATQNEKVLTWHMIEDVIGWAVVLVGAILIMITGYAWIDPALAIGLSLFVLFNVSRHLKETAYLFLQGRPDNFDEDSFLEAAAAIPGVEKIDHLAVWSLDGETSILSARLHLHAVREPMEIERVKASVRNLAVLQGAQATLETCLEETAPHPEEFDSPTAEER